MEIKFIESVVYADRYRSVYAAGETHDVPRERALKLIGRGLAMPSSAGYTLKLKERERAVSRRASLRETRAKE